MTDSVRQAREALGAKLRELRRSNGLTGAVLAERLGWPASKVSKLETGRQAPTRDDLTGWVRETSESQDDAEALSAMLSTLEVAQAEWQRLLRGGVHHHQGTWSNLERKATRFRVFEPVYVPGLLQTAGYARHRLAQAAALFGTTNDVDAAVNARLNRQDILYDQRRRFYFILTEATLRYRLCPPTDMLAQLDRIVSASALPNVRLGIIPFDTPYVIAPGLGFTMLDDDRVIVETFSAELTLTQQAELDLHATVFGAMASAASYDADARHTIAQVIHDLTNHPDTTTHDQ